MTFNSCISKFYIIGGTLSFYHQSTSQTQPPSLVNHKFILLLGWFLYCLQKQKVGVAGGSHQAASTSNDQKQQRCRKQ